MSKLLRQILDEAQQSLSKKRFGKETWQLSKDEKLQFAIENCRRIRITYDDEKGGKGKKTRYILPLVYGVTKYGKRAIRAYQTFGSTKRGVPKYKLFLVKRIGQIDVGRIKYYDFEQQLLDTGFNDAGDKGFSAIYSITPLAKNYHGRGYDTKPIDSEPIDKVDVSTNPDAETSAQTQPTKPQNRQNKPVVTGKKQKPSKTIEKDPNADYFVNKVMSPNTEPVTKADVEPQQEPSTEIGTTQPQGTESGNKAEKMTGNDGFVTKAEIDGEPQEPEGQQPQISRDNPLTRKYQDMMDRMKNVENGYPEEENNNEEDNEEKK